MLRKPKDPGEGRAIAYEITSSSLRLSPESRDYVMNKSVTKLAIFGIGFRPRIKYGVTPCQARGGLFFRRNDGRGEGDNRGDSIHMR